MSPAIKNQVTKPQYKKAHETLHQSRQILFQFISVQNNANNNWYPGTCLAQYKGLPVKAKIYIYIWKKNLEDIKNICTGKHFKVFLETVNLWV